MPQLISAPTRIPAPGNKEIDEYLGRLNRQSEDVSVAHMKSTPGWSEPGQRPDFREITVVLGGTLHVEHIRGAIEVSAGQAIVTEPGEWVRYSIPGNEGAEYVAICLPAFSPGTVHRDTPSAA